MEAVVQTDKVACPREQVADIRRMVAEVVRQVAVRAGAVDEATSVRANTAAEEVPWRRLYAPFLPRLEGYPALVLFPWSVPGARS